MTGRVVYQPVKLLILRLISFDGCPFPPVQPRSETINLTAPIALLDLQRAANGNLVQNMLDALEATARGNDEASN
jgi:hypothetical protein